MVKYSQGDKSSPPPPLFLFHVQLGKGIYNRRRKKQENKDFASLEQFQHIAILAFLLLRFKTVEKGQTKQ